MSKIDAFRSQLTNGGHRSNRYKAVVNFPANISGSHIDKAQKSFEFLAYDTTWPEQELDEVTANYKGRVVHFASDIKAPSEWECTVYNTTSFDIRNALIEWRNQYMNADEVTGSNLIETATVELIMLDKNDVELQKCTMYNAWPISIGSIKVGWGDTASISNFALKMRYDYIIDEPVAQSGASI